MTGWWMRRATGGCREPDPAHIGPRSPFASVSRLATHMRISNLSVLSRLAVACVGLLLIAFTLAATDASVGLAELPQGHGSGQGGAYERSFTVTHGPAVTQMVTAGSTGHQLGDLVGFDLHRLQSLLELLSFTRSRSHCALILVHVEISQLLLQLLLDLKSLVGCFKGIASVLKRLDLVDPFRRESSRSQLIPLPLSEDLAVVLLAHRKQIDLIGEIRYGRHVTAVDGLPFCLCSNILFDGLALTSQRFELLRLLESLASSFDGRFLQLKHLRHLGDLDAKPIGSLRIASGAHNGFIAAQICKLLEG